MMPIEFIIPLAVLCYAGSIFFLYAEDIASFHGNQRFDAEARAIMTWSVRIFWPIALAVSIVVGSLRALVWIVRNIMPGLRFFGRGVRGIFRGVFPARPCVPRARVVERDR